MRAVVHDRYGPPEVLRLEEVARPVPADDEILVKVYATTVNRTDTGLRSAELVISRAVTGWRRPRNRILGMEFAGEVAETGRAVTEFKVGDEVVGGIGSGAWAEYVVVKQTGAVAHRPVGLSLDEAAPLIDGAELALACLRTAGALEGRSVLVYGASGAVGSAGVQLARHLGAEVTAVCSTRSLELARSLGAHAVIDRTQEDFTRNGKVYDVIFDAVGMTSFRRCRRSVKPSGTYVDTDLGFGFHIPLLLLATKWVGTKRVKMGITRYTKEDVLLLKGLVEKGAFRPVIDRMYPFDEVIEAVKYVEAGHKTGNVVLKVAG